MLQLCLEDFRQDPERLKIDTVPQPSTRVRKKPVQRVGKKSFQRAKWLQFLSLPFEQSVCQIDMVDIGRECEVAPGALPRQAVASAGEIPREDTIRLSLKCLHGWGIE